MSSTVFSLDRILMAGVLLLLIWLPLPLASNREWALGVMLLWIGGLGLIWAVAQWRAVLPPGKALKPGLPLLGLLLLAQLWVALQWATGLSMDTGATLQALLLGCALSLLFLLTLSLFRSRKRLNWLLGTLVVSGTLQGFYGAFMTLTGIEWLLLVPKETYIGNATGTFVNRNSMAGYLAMCLAAGIGLLMAWRDSRDFRWTNLIEMLLGPKARLRLALVIMVIALVMTHSRGGNAAFFAALLCVGGLFVLRDKRNRLRNGLILASILIIDVLVISQYFGLERLKDRVLSTQFTDVVVDGAVVQKANELRDDVFFAAIPLAQERPWTGQGAGSFEAVFPRFPGPDIRLHFDLAHNDYMQFFVEFGVLGFAPLLLFVLLVLRLALQPVWLNESLYRSGVGMGVGVGVLAIGFHGLTDFDLQMPANAATFVVLCAVAVLANHHSSVRRKTG
ncbi:O-antigen ligase family protein [Halopseudomonas salegens]|uniref:O-antigen ligase n=1 Tax=Halopseudomonas salegens TaxID=1434072 RepID=A0A1H2FKZ0_9GAMM|nr:O-antigen ligase family protein [Halopseudomonas salegens]SDU07972.1 O-antigen ligase [Halopseudomonas salegens]